MSSGTETLAFQAESRQLLQLMVHSIYTNKDIFLRELISNASDALDKLRLQSLVDDGLGVDVDDLHIELVADPKARTLTVRDNGIGMTRDEVVQLIGTIAKSGTAEFLQKMKDAKDAAASAELIGNFGVGFYSSFMVADRVTLLTRRAGQDTATRWESTGEGSYTVSTVEEAPQGTEVTLHLKDTDVEDRLFDYTAEPKIREIVRQHSDFIPWPIRMAVERPGDGEDEGRTTTVTETLNSMKALWARSQDDIEEAEYQEFYKHISHDWNNPLETVHTRAEGTFEYQALLFVPAHAPLDLFMKDGKHGVQLYVKRVFIMDDCDDLMPGYLRFVKGVVDAQDLTLNVSREMLQQDRRIQLMRRRLVKKVLATVKTMMTGASDDDERYRTFWREYGRAVKEGLLSDPDNRDAILDIASFDSTHDPDKATGLRAYKERMKDGQQHIYYLTGESRSVIENSPHLEAFRDKGYEVLLLTDPVDAVWVDAVDAFDGTPFTSIAKGQVDLDADRETAADDPGREQRDKDFAGLLGWLGTTLGSEVKEVRLSSRLTTSPACIVGDTGDLTPTLEKMYRAMGQDLPPVKRILELNPGHPLVTALRTSHEQAAGKEGDNPALADTAELLYGMALLAEGGELRDPARFTRVLANRLAYSL